MAKSAALARAKPFAHRRSCRLTLVPDGRRSAGQGMSGRPSHRNDATLGRSWRRIWSGIASSGADVVLIVLASSFSRQTAKGRPVLALPVRSLYRLTCSRLDVMQWERPLIKRSLCRLLTRTPPSGHDTRQPLGASYSGVIPEDTSRTVACSCLRTALIVAAVTALTVLPTLGHRVVATTDEARFVLYAREVLTQHRLFDVRLRGAFFREKPPLYAWIIAAFSLPGGRVTEATAQAPIALAAIAAAVFTCFLGRRW